MFLNVSVLRLVRVIAVFREVSAFANSPERWIPTVRPLLPLR